MSINKTRIAFISFLPFEAGVATFFDKRKYEVVRVEYSKINIVHSLDVDIPGEWCYPLKQGLALIDQMDKLHNVDIILSMVNDCCKFPMLINNTSDHLKLRAHFYTILYKPLSLSLQGIFQTYKTLKKIIKKYHIFKFLIKLPVAFFRYMFSYKVEYFFHKSLPLVKNALRFSCNYQEFKKKYVMVSGIKETIQISKDFFKKTRESYIKDKPKFKVLLTGDFSVIALGFPIFDVEQFLARSGIEVVNPSLARLNLEFILTSRGRKAIKIINKVVSPNCYNRNVDKNYLLEKTTLLQILKGLDMGVDGIIFLKPIMCAPCDNLSYILKMNNNFNTNIVELTYDEHSGVQGIITRLEAFVNIIEENRVNDIINANA